MSLKTTELSMNRGKDPEFISSRQVSRMPTLVWIHSKRPWNKSLGWFRSRRIVNSEDSHRSTIREYDWGQRKVSDAHSMEESLSGLNSPWTCWDVSHGSPRALPRLHWSPCEGCPWTFNPLKIMYMPSCCTSENIPTGLPKHLGMSVETTR